MCGGGSQGCSEWVGGSKEGVAVGGELRKCGRWMYGEGGW